MKKLQEALSGILAFLLSGILIVLGTLMYITIYVLSVSIPMVIAGLIIIYVIRLIV